MTAPVPSATRRDPRTQAVDWAKARWADFTAFTPGQKAVTIVAVLALAIGGYLLATWKTDPAYAPLYSNLAATDAGAITSKLDEKGIPYKLTDGGAGITVPSGQVAAARLAVSAAGLPNAGDTGYALLDKEGVTTSQFKQQVDYQRAVEGELGRTIRSIDGVQAASVHLAIPKDDVFSDGSSQPTAAVLLTLSPGTVLTSGQVKSVVYLVSSSVTGMKAANVTVTDSSGAVLSSPDGVAGGVSGALADATASRDQQMTQKLQAAIDSSLGAGHATVVVNSVLSSSTSTTKSNRYVYDPKAPPVSESQSKEKYTGTGTPASGTLGTVDTGANGSGGNGTYENTTTTKDNALGTESTETQTPAGVLESQHIAVLVDQKAKNLNLTAMRNLVETASGFDAQRDTLSVQAVPFDTSAQDAATRQGKEAAAAQAAAAAHERLMAYVKQGVFAALVLALVVGTWLAARRRARAREEAVREAEIRAETDAVLDDLGAEPAVTDTPTAPVPAAAGGPVSGGPARTRAAALAAVDDRPADAALVLSGWLSNREN